MVMKEVYTVSLHGKNNFPFRKQVSDWDIEFENDTEDEQYLETLDQVLLKLSEKEFDLVFFRLESMDWLRMHLDY